MLGWGAQYLLTIICQLATASALVLVASFIPPCLGPGLNRPVFSFRRRRRMRDIIERGMGARRSIEEALADLLPKYKRFPSADLARMIRQLQAGIGERALKDPRRLG